MLSRNEPTVRVHPQFQRKLYPRMVVSVSTSPTVHDRIITCHKGNHYDINRAMTKGKLSVCGSCSLHCGLHCGAQRLRL